VNTESILTIDIETETWIKIIIATSIAVIIAAAKAQVANAAIPNASCSGADPG
jgi:hypothetical protein